MISGVSIGIHVHAQPEGLQATLAALRGTVSGEVDVVLLPDGPDPAVYRTLEALRHYKQSGTARPCGAAACFNRLAQTSHAGVVILLESGAIVAPGWLDLLLAALQAGPRHGLAGPSTNCSWNEQGVFPDARDGLEQIAHTAQEAERRFGQTTRTLEPLYSLADFCYAVRREVIEDIGLADEGYGCGPCWEMDYNIRAARAGWHGVWACGAYVHRAPFTERRRRDEARLFTASRHRYQDKFCGLRLRGEGGAYEPHCKGDACEHFAPKDLIALRLTPSGITAAAPGTGSPVPAAVCAGPPLVSCIMPTANRADFVLQAVRCFLRQDYPNCELIIADESTPGLREKLPADPRLRCLTVPRGKSIGEKRNAACAEARGEFIVHWDDDDWYGPGRISAQMAPLLDGRAGVSALRSDLFFDLHRWRFWRCTDALHRRLFVEDVHGGTLAYARSVWERGCRFPDRSLAEDAIFLRAALRKGARLERLPGVGHFIYLRHGENAWRFECGRHQDPGGWMPAEEPPLPAEDHAFYAALSRAVPSASVPLVSCLMPTCRRRAFVPQAIRCFLDQDYAEKELIIVNDGGERINDLVPAHPAVRLIELEGRRSLGAKRNLACQEARGNVLVHWDDDDWSAPWRVSYQAAELRRLGADLCGLNRVWFYDPAARRAWHFVYPSRERPWVYGASLCYTREFWQRHPFPEINVGEDTRFVWSDPSARLCALENPDFLVATIHSANTSRKRTADPRYREISADSPAAIAAYRAQPGLEARRS